MAHVAKFTAGSAGRILGHCDREMDASGEYLKYRTSSDIDTRLTEKNMALSFDDGLTSQERLHKRLSEVHVLKRKDVNVLCDWVVTYPKELPLDEDSIGDFFDSTLEFLMDRYGEKNTISANVHMDEAQPHLHFCFVPVVFDEKKGYEKVSAKQVLDRKDLNTFHGDLEAHLEKDIGLERGLVLSGVTREQGGNRTIGQLKVEKLRKETELLLKEIGEYEERINRVISDFKESDDWKSITHKLDEEKFWHVPIPSWFSDREDVKIKKDVIKMPVKALSDVFHAVSLLDARNQLTEIENSLKREISTLYEHDPADIDMRLEAVAKKEKEADRKLREAEKRYEQQANLNERFEDLQLEVAALERHSGDLEEQIEGLNQELRRKSFADHENDSMRMELRQAYRRLNEVESVLKENPALARAFEQARKTRLNDRER